MKPPPAFQLYAQDFLVGTADMTAEEVGAYIRLLCYQWVKDGLPNDPAKLAVLAGCHGNASAMPLHKFGTCQDGMLRNPRLEQIRKANAEYREKQAENGKKRWDHSKEVGSAMASLSGGNAKPVPTLMPEGMPNACSSSSSSSSSSIISSDKDVGKNAAGAAPTSDASWLESLKVDPAYIGIDVAIEHAKAARWCEMNRKQLSRRRFINWLNRAERPMGNAKPQSEFAHAW